jgi:hypothetical protein
VAFLLLPQPTTAAATTMMMSTSALRDAQLRREATSIDLNIPGDVLRAATSGLIINTDNIYLSGEDEGNHHRLFKVALFGNRQILVYACNTSTTTTTTTPMECIAVVQMSSARLVYWIFITVDIILLLTTHAGYTLKVRRVAAVDAEQASQSSKPDSSSGPKPIKIFDRIDLPPNDDDGGGGDGGGGDDLVKDMVVSDVQVFQDGWTMVTSCSNNSPSSSSSSSSSTATTSSTSHSRTNNSIISLYQAKSGRAISFYAVCGSFRLGLQHQGQVVLVVDHSCSADTNKDNDHSYGFTVLLMDLDAIHKYWQSMMMSMQSTATATDSSVGITSQKQMQQQQKKYWIDPLHLTDLHPALTLQASLTIPSADCFKGDAAAVAATYHSSYIWCLRHSLFMLTSQGVLYQINSNTNPLTKERLRLLGHASILPTPRAPLHSATDGSPQDEGGDGGLGSPETEYAVVGATMSLQDPSKPSIRFILHPTGDIVDVSLKGFSSSLSIAQGLI